MRISKHAKEALRSRFNQSVDVVPGLLEKSKVMTQRQVNRCGTSHREGYIYLKSGKMILVVGRNVLVNVLWFDNPYQRLKAKLCPHLS